MFSSPYVSGQHMCPLLSESTKIAFDIFGFFIYEMHY